MLPKRSLLANRFEGAIERANRFEGFKYSHKGSMGVKVYSLMLWWRTLAKTLMRILRIPLKELIDLKVLEFSQGKRGCKEEKDVTQCFKKEERKPRIKRQSSKLDEAWMAKSVLKEWLEGSNKFELVAATLATRKKEEAKQASGWVC